MEAKEFEKKTIKLVRENVRKYPNRNALVFDFLYKEIRELLGEKEKGGETKNG